MAEQIVIAKNNSVSDVEIEDLGLTVLANSSLNLTSILLLKNILSSKSLYSLVDTNVLIINDGTQDLSKSVALDYITVEVYASTGGTSGTYSMCEFSNLTSQNLNTSTPTRIKWDDTIYNDISNYTLNSTTGVVSVLTGGLYDIQFRVNISFLGNQSCTSVYIQSGSTIISSSSAYLESYRVAKLIGLVRIVKWLPAPTTLSVWGIRVNAGTTEIITLANQCSFLIVKLRNL